MKLDSMSDLYLMELRDMYSGEKQLVKALPKMAKGASTRELRAAIESHLQQTQNHVNRLETIFKSLGEKPGGETCEAMQGLIAEGEEILKADGEDAVRDAGLVMAAQKVEHYEMATYGTLREHAHLLNREQDADLLRQTLEEEKMADRKLSEIAENVVNKRALV